MTDYIEKITKESAMKLETQENKQADKEIAEMERSQERQFVASIVVQACHTPDWEDMPVL